MSREAAHNPKVAGSNPAPATFPLALSVLTGEASALVHRVANPKGAMRISRQIRRRLPARSSGFVRSLPIGETILTRSCPRTRRVQRAGLQSGVSQTGFLEIERHRGSTGRAVARARARGLRRAV